MIMIMVCIWSKASNILNEFSVQLIFEFRRGLDGKRFPTSYKAYTYYKIYCLENTSYFNFARLSLSIQWGSERSPCSIRFLPSRCSQRRTCKQSQCLMTGESLKGVETVWLQSANKFPDERKTASLFFLLSTLVGRQGTPKQMTKRARLHLYLSYTL